MVRTLKGWTAAAVLTVIATAVAWAADVNGKWAWKQMGPDGEIAYTLELKQEGEKLTGIVTRADQKSEIQNGTIKENDLAFDVVRERDGEQFKIMYKGKVEGDTIKGNTVVNIGGEERTREWTATRVK